MRTASMALAIALSLTAGCSKSSTPSPCGADGVRFDGDHGAVCAYAVVEGGFLCPSELPARFELPRGEVICAAEGSAAADLPPDACVHLGYADCTEAHRPSDPREDGGTFVLDSGSTVDAGTDAGEPAACDMLEMPSWSGATAFGSFDGAVAAFSAADCVTMGGANLTLRTAAGDEMLIVFEYPVDVTAEGRTVSGPFEVLARVYWRSSSGMPAETTAMIRVDVVAWAEHSSDPAGHEIDATVAFLDARFDGAPIVVRGRFCEWLSLLC